MLLASVFERVKFNSKPSAMSENNLIKLFGTNKFLFSLGTLFGIFVGLSIQWIRPVNKSKPSTVRLTPIDIYAKNNFGSCVRLVNGLGCPATCFKVGAVIGATRIISTSGTHYTLWDNANCNNNSGGQQISFL